MNIVLVGPPASGKGTQSILLEEKFDLVHISTGELLRNIVSQKSQLAEDIKSYIDNGKLVPDNLITELLQSFLATTNAKNGVLLDGYPRTVEQAKSLQTFMNIDFVFEIKISKQTLVKRLIDRLSCPKCGRSYLKSKHQSDKCDKCHTKLVKRSDDTKQVAEKRYEEYCKQTYPIIDYYKNSKCYHQIDGEKSPNEVFDQICKAIGRC